jgi:phospho-N-acetylmuramoyl-pentapeptide-transferase
VIYQWLVPLREYFHPLNVFQYITFRTAYATVMALLLCFALGPGIIARLKAAQFVDTVREDLPEGHRAKGGTPTMGGILILIAIVVPTLFWANLTSPYVQMALAVTVVLGGIGFLDDYLLSVRHRPKGLVGRYKILGQVMLGLVVGSIIYLKPDSPQWAGRTEVPFLKEHFIHMGILYVPFCALVITGASNAVNLTDGLDGLAIGVVAVAGAAFALVSYVSGNARFSDYLDIAYLPASGELTVFCGALLGAALGFLWFNAHPAQVFMGDTGSLALGGALGTIAILLRKEYLLFFVGGLFVVEALSVILQVASFRLRGKRIFRMAPIHHHFELLGWPETQVVVRFWIVAVVFALLGLSTLKLR